MIKLDEEKASIATLILKRIMERNLQDDKVLKKVQNLNADIFLKVGEMTSTLIFRKGDIEIREGKVSNSSSYIEGSLSDFISIALGKYPLMAFLKRKIKLGGNLFNLLPLVKVFKV